MESTLYHYGRKGMKWGQNIFSKKQRALRKKRKSQKQFAKRLQNGDVEAKKQYEKELQDLIADSQNVKVKARKGKTRLYKNPLTRAKHVVDENGNVLMSYLDGVAGARLVEYGKSHSSKIISKHFKDFYDDKMLNDLRELEQLEAYEDEFDDF